MTCSSPRLRSLFAAVFTAAALASPALAWDGSGHRMITRVALRGLSSDMPAWLKDDKTVYAAADQAQQPDRWRSVRTPQLKHCNEPDHYLDVEDLAPLGMTLETMPPLRHEFVKQVTLARAKPDFAGEPVNEAKDPAKTSEYPGMLPYATLETYGKIVGAFKVVRAVEALNEPEARAAQLEAAQWNARVHIGQLAHYVGDSTQPLHMTKHHHGWVGDNPEGYTTDRNFHRYIDGEVLRLHDIKDADVAARADFERSLDRANQWGEEMSYLSRSFSRMEPLYKLKKSGALEQAEGKEFIVGCLADAASQLSALIEQAWLEAAPTPQETQDLVKYEGTGAALEAEKEHSKAEPSSK